MVIPRCYLDRFRVICSISVNSSALFFNIFLQFLSSGLEKPRGVISWLRNMHRYGSLAWKRWAGFGDFHRFEINVGGGSDNFADGIDFGTDFADFCDLGLM